MLCLSPIGAAAHVSAAVGAGISGLTSALRLTKGNLHPLVFEARARAGGRMLTKTVPLHNLTVELGGTFIDSDHHEIQALAKELGVRLRRVIDDQQPNYLQLINNTLSTSRDNFQRFKSTLTDIASDQQALLNADPNITQLLFKSSIADYLQSKSAPPDLTALINLITQNEYGVDLNHMRADMLFEIISLDMEKEAFSINGQLGDEAFVIDGGGQALITKLAEQLHNPIRYNHELVRIAKRGSGYLLQFNTADGLVEIVADSVITTLPIAFLREHNIIDIANFPAHLHHFIKNRPAGRNIKTMLIFDEAHWNRAKIGNRFNLLTNHFWIWDNGDNASLTAFAGGSSADRTELLADADLELELLDALSQVVPTIRNHHKLTLRGPQWYKDKFSGESYTGSCEPGVVIDETAFDVAHFENLYFAGTGFSKNYEGFMNGAVETANRAAALVLQNIKE